MYVKYIRKDGRGDWIRTSDPLNPIQVRYQTALRPDIFRLQGTASYKS